jgi:acetyltransferase-like isoleucine patch superfamily enzyme
MFRQWPSGLWRLEARFKGAQLLGKTEFLGRPLISVAPGSRMVIGDGLHAYSAVRANPLANFQPCVLRTLVPGAQLVLGRNVGLSATVLCAGGSIEIGDGTIFGAGSLVIDNDFHVPVGEFGWSEGLNRCGEISKPVVIGRGVFVGARAMVLKGVRIGDRAVIGAGAVVARDVPERHLAVGNPARILPPKP